MTDPEITQADRDLVASLLDADDELVEQINAGLAFSAECICAARHRMLGRAEEVGSEHETGAVLYGTTGQFLERMGLRNLDELPALAPYLPEVDLLDEIAEQGRS